MYMNKLSIFFSCVYLKEAVRRFCGIIKNKWHFTECLRNEVKVFDGNGMNVDWA